MKKMIESINNHWKNTYVSVEDKDGEKARGIFEHLEWYIQPDYYTKDNNIPLLKCFIIPKTNKEKEEYPVSDAGTYVCVLDTMSMRLVPLDENGNTIKRNIQKFNNN